jgi:DNA-3-methyladenine glycosylase
LTAAARETTRQPVPPAFEELVGGSALAAAPWLLGWTLLVEGVGGRIVEVEAYEPGDPASHSYRGRTARNAAMFGPPGHLYVYRSYGVHWCANVTCGPEGTGAAVLLRALDPTVGLDAMRRRRAVADPRLLCSGPGRLTQALGIDSSHDGADLSAPPFGLVPPERAVPYVATPRIGISRAVELPWRFVAEPSSPSGRARRRARP